MKMLKTMGLLLFAAGLCILGYQAIEAIMAQGTGPGFTNYTLIDIFGEEAFAWRADFSISTIVMGVDYLVSVPAYLLLIIIGSVFLIINGIYAKR